MRVMPTPSDISKGHRALRGDGREISATQGVVPILRELEKGQTHVMGTGFYITRYGLFLTARHVFDHIIEADEHKRDRLGLRRPRGRGLCGPRRQRSKRLPFSRSSLFHARQQTLARCCRRHRVIGASASDAKQTSLPLAKWTVGRIDPGFT